MFFTGQIGLKDQLFLDVTARNDWTSTLAYTKYKNKGFFYPSVGLTWLLNETLKLPSWISLGKIRGAWSQVGNGLDTYLSAINLDIQGLTENVHEFVHELPRN